MKMPISDSYPDSLIARLKDSNYAAGYLDACLAENDPDSELLHLVLSNVAKALGSDNLTPEESQIHQEKLDELLAEGGSDAIYGLAAWLQSLGLKLTVQVAEDRETEETVETNVTGDVAVTPIQ